jgi:hypothetical protein
MVLMCTHIVTASSINDISQNLIVREIPDTHPTESDGPAPSACCQVAAGAIMT